MVGRTFRSCVAAVVAVLSFPNAAGAAEVKPFFTASGVCGTGAYGYVGGQASDRVVGTHRDTLQRILNEGDSDIVVNGDESVNGQDASWSVGPSVSDSEVVRWYWDSCKPGETVIVELYDVPKAPVSFSGSDTYPSASGITFVVPADGRYSATVTLTQGAVTIEDGSVTKTFASSGSLDLGNLGANATVDLRIAAKDGAQAKWQVAIRAMPAQITGVAFDKAVGGPGSILTATYTVTATVTLTATVLGPDGAAVRALAAGLRVRQGEHTLTWDALDGAGKPVPNGAYTLRLAGSDVTGATVSATAQVQIDSEAPSIKIVPGITTPDTPVQAGVADPGGNAADVTVRVDGRQAASYGAVTTLSYKPPAGWTPGRHVVTIVARDKLGNVGTVTRTIVVRGKAKGARAGKAV